MTLGKTCESLLGPSLSTQSARGPHLSSLPQSPAIFADWELWAGVQNGPSHHHDRMQIKSLRTASPFSCSSAFLSWLWPQKCHILCTKRKTHAFGVCLTYHRCACNLTFASPLLPTWRAGPWRKRWALEHHGTYGQACHQQLLAQSCCVPQMS